jgi:archaeal type IV pilus assembly protein PilA
MIRNRNHERGVSPVIGVMLMLVVTIIIAALVSAVAGGMGKSTEKTPEASLTGTFSQSSGLILYHNGGDSLVTKDIQIIARRSDEFGAGKGVISAITVNASTITDQSGNNWITSSGTYLVMSWRPGEPMYITKDNLANSGLMVGGYWKGTETSLTDPSNLGKTVTFDIGYKNGKTIASTAVVIQP